MNSVTVGAHRRPAAARRAAGSAGTAVRLSRLLRTETVVVAAVLVALEAVLFSRYFSGELTANWDFLGSYNSEAFAWWHDGSFFDPPQWMPYLWGGYPAAASVQNSAWYLPVGAVAELVPFTIRAASALQALHVAFGALGMYVLVRRWGLDRVAGTFALVAYFFAVGFFSNAQHVDIVRTYAWLPWVFLVASPHWPWRRVWSIPAAAVVLWQTAISAYPGILVQAAYALLAWVVLCQLTTRAPLRRYVIPLAVSGVTAVLLSLVKFLPIALVRGAVGSPLPAHMVFDLSIAGTLFFPFDFDWIPNDPTMRSFFVVAPVIPLALMSRWRQGLVPPALGVLVVGVGIGLPVWPWTSLVDGLPGLSLSRFRLGDSRALVVFALVALAAAGLSALVRRDGPLSRRWATVARAIAVCLVPVVAFVVARAAGFPRASWEVPLLLLLLSSLVALGLLALVHRGRRTGTGVWVGATALVVVAAVSGVHWASQAQRVWQVPRVESESAQWGATSGALALGRVDDPNRTQRPARQPLPEGVTPPLAFSQLWNSGFYAGTYAVGGYINLAGTPTFDAIMAEVTQPDSDQAMWQAFWAAPGIVLAEDRLAPSDPAVVGECATNGECGSGLRVVPVSFSDGEWRYDVTASAPTSVVLNEAYYPGLTVETCAAAGQTGCTRTAADAGPGGSVRAEVPEGASEVVLRYVTPGQVTGWVAFGVGAAVVVLAALVQWAAGRRARRRARPDDVRVEAAG